MSTPTTSSTGLTMPRYGDELDAAYGPALAEATAAAEQARAATEKAMGSWMP